MELEKSSDIKPFTYQDEIRKKFSFWRDIASNVWIVPQNSKEKREFLMFKSVTRVLTVLSIILIIGFTGLSCKYYYRSNIQTGRSILGEKLIERDLTRFYPGAKIIEVLGPIKNSKGESIIQLRIIKTTGEQSFVNWRIDESGAAILNEEG